MKYLKLFEDLGNKNEVLTTVKDILLDLPDEFEYEEHSLPNCWVIIIRRYQVDIHIDGLDHYLFKNEELDGVVDRIEEYFRFEKIVNETEIIGYNGRNWVDRWGNRDSSFTSMNRDISLSKSLNTSTENRGLVSIRIQISK